MCRFVSTSLIAQERPKKQTKGQIRQMRIQGQIPASLYGNHKEACKISVPTKDFLKEMETPGIRSRIFDLGQFGKALVQSAQFSPIGNVPIHLDFLRVGERVSVSVPLKIVNARLSPGVKRGGIVNMVVRELRLSSPSDKIPAFLSVDLEGRDIGDSIDIQSLSLDPSLKILESDLSKKIVSIVAPSGLPSSSEESKNDSDEKAG